MFIAALHASEKHISYQREKTGCNNVLSDALEFHHLVAEAKLRQQVQQAGDF